jgi:tRNA threonylcarbamoyladenosine biosynthesis protein TsaE
MSTDILHLPDEQATLALGARLALALEPGMSVHLLGDLGAGKTTFARGLIHALGYRGRVKSPTFTLVEPYRLSRLSLYHFDFYRFDDPHAWLEAGFREHFNDTDVCLVEWPEKAGPELPRPDLVVRLDVAAHGGRNVMLQAYSEKGERCLVQVSGGSSA